MTKRTVWQIMLTVAAFTGFLLGYAVPPLVEVGMIGGSGKPGEAGIKGDVDKNMEEFYRDLYKNN